MALQLLRKHRGKLPRSHIRAFAGWGFQIGEFGHPKAGSREMPVRREQVQPLAETDRVLRDKSGVNRPVPGHVLQVEVILVKTRLFEVRSPVKRRHRLAESALQQVGQHREFREHLADPARPVRR